MGMRCDIDIVMAWGQVRKTKISPLVRVILETVNFIPNYFLLLFPNFAGKSWIPFGDENAAG